MMMESPIDPMVNKVVFHTIVGGLSAAVAFSLLRQRWYAQSSLDAPFAELQKAKTQEDKYSCLQSIYQSLMDDLRSKRGDGKIAVSRHIKPLIQHVTLAKDDSNSDLVEVTLRIIQKAFAGDKDSRAEFNSRGGCEAVLTTLGRAHAAQNLRIMEDAARTLEMLTAVEESAIVLPGDVPHGTEGAYTVSQKPAATAMLRVLDPEASVIFLSSVTGIYANLTALHVGAKAIAKGVDGHSGMWYFLRLLTHHNSGVIEHSANTVSYLVRAGVGHEEISEEENITLIADLISINMDIKTVNSALTIIVSMLDSKHSKTFFSNLEHKTAALNSLFSVWCKGSDRVIRERAEVLVQLLRRCTSCTASIERLIAMYQSSIMERRAMDEEARRKAMQQAQKQQMMQQMMMGGGGMDLGAMMGM